MKHSKVLKNLVGLVLYNNQLNSIDPKILKQLKKLEQLNLMDNLLTMQNVIFLVFSINEQ